MSGHPNDRPTDLGYQLVDFGEGRKLESFGGRLLDRPSPAADGTSKRRPEQWNRSDSVFDAVRRKWDHRTPWPTEWLVELPGFRMPLSPTPFGHVGVFPEQIDNWKWLASTAPPPNRNDSDPSTRHRRSGLNLFGYTGAGSVVMAVGGMDVAHVDAAKQNASTARAAARANGLGDHPIRYLVDDAAKFVSREVRRGNRYHTIVMDPPAYGHSPSGKAWRLERDIWPLIDDCLEILTPDHFRLLITGHSPQVGTADVLDYLASRVPKRLGLRGRDFDASIRSGRLTLTDLANRKLDAGFFVRCSHSIPNA
ncbi:MAG: class I SAM-dependent methyltransferase [Planctomycetales bacterium]|nr:class I SAM-dependent methyltransferase [Planctomycetales bacterium]